MKAGNVPHLPVQPAWWKRFGAVLILADLRWISSGVSGLPAGDKC